MIWRSAICFSLAALCLLMEANAAPVRGSISLVHSTQNYAQRKNDFSGVVVWLTGVDADLKVPAHSRAQMLQKNKSFAPHVLAVPTGTRVDFPNLDPIFHNAFSSFDGQMFDVALYPPGSSRSVQFNRAGVVRVFCNIHPFMSAIIVVADSPYIAITDEKGNFSFADVTPGTYRVHYFYERATAEVLQRLMHNIVVPESGFDAGTVPISEAGYLPMAHKNKYGRDYPSTADPAKSYSWNLP